MSSKTEGSGIAGTDERSSVLKDDTATVSHATGDILRLLLTSCDLANGSITGEIYRRQHADRLSEELFLNRVVIFVSPSLESLSILHKEKEQQIDSSTRNRAAKAGRDWQLTRGLGGRGRGIGFDMRDRGAQ